MCSPSESRTPPVSGFEIPLDDDLRMTRAAPASFGAASAIASHAPPSAATRSRADCGMPFVSTSNCVLSWNRDPATGVIFIQSGPRRVGSTLASRILGGRDWNADCGDDRQDTPGVLFPW